MESSFDEVSWNLEEEDDNKEAAGNYSREVGGGLMVPLRLRCTEYPHAIAMLGDGTTRRQVKLTRGCKGEVGARECTQGEAKGTSKAKTAGTVG